MGWLKGLFTNSEPSEKSKEWIGLDITLPIEQSKIQKAKLLFQKYSRELDWDLSYIKWKERVNYNKDNNWGLSYREWEELVFIVMKPKNNEVSPTYFLENKDKIFAIAKELSSTFPNKFKDNNSFNVEGKLITAKVGKDNFITLRDTSKFNNWVKKNIIIQNYNHLRKSISDYEIKNMANRFDNKEANEPDFIINHSIGFLNFSYNLRDRITLSKEDKIFEIKLFDLPIEEELKRLFKNVIGTNMQGNVSKHIERIDNPKDIDYFKQIVSKVFNISL